MAGAGAKSDSEEVFVALCGECRAIATELKDFIEDVQLNIAKKKTGVVRSFLTALNEVWTAIKIRDLSKRLD